MIHEMIANQNECYQGARGMLSIIGRVHAVTGDIGGFQRILGRPNRVRGNLPQSCAIFD